jgi:hypothetical protein
MTEIQPGSTTTEWKIVLLNYVAGCSMIGASVWMENSGKDGSELMVLATSFLALNGVSYSAARTMLKKRIVAAPVTPEPTPEVKP